MKQQIKQINLKQGRSANHSLPRHSAGGFNPCRARMVAGFQPLAGLAGPEGGVSDPDAPGSRPIANL
ncbi:hypothetical protein [Microcoleus sp. herbarium12]|uniref:hypothetical protein n=1 Tax=Microcoleus sp. herbarium12 TaxID=3055437 RepID=UPI002FD18008